MKIDKKIIKELSDYLDEFNLTEIEYSENNVKYKVSKSSKGVVREQIVSTDNQTKPSSAASTITSENINKANIIKSPMVGTAYLAQGYLQLNKVSVYANKFIDSYEVTIFGAVSSFAREINRTYLTDLSSLSQYNHTSSYFHSRRN